MTEKGTVFFFTGLAGAGKTTIGGLFFMRLKKRNPDSILIDGDQRRATIGNRDYSTEARLAGAKRLFARCLALSNEGHHVVVCSISMYREVYEWNRNNIERYKEIYLKVSMDTLYRRDQKGLYSSGAKQVVGVDLPYDEPKFPDVVIENEGDESPEEIVLKLGRLFGI